MKHDAEQHVKFKLLQQKLGLCLWQTKGVLESIWGLCATNAMQGDIGKFSNEEICACIEWEGDPDKFINALVECRWFDACDEHRLLVHDWADHCPNFIKGNLSKHKKPFAVRVTKQPAKQSTKQPAKHGATKPNQTKPNQIYSASDNAGHAILTSKKGRKLQGNELEWFKLFWEAFNHKKGKAEAVDAWLDIKELNQSLAEAICEAAKNEALSRQAKHDAGQTPIMAQGWLSGRRWEDEPTEIEMPTTGGNSKVMGL